MSSLIPESDLLKAFGYQRRADLMRRLDDLGIPYHLGKGGQIVTTIQAVNLPLTGQNGDTDEPATVRFK